MSTAKKVSADKQLLKEDYIFKLIVIAAALFSLLFIGGKILGEDFKEVFGWWLMLLACGISFMPLTLILLRQFKDSGWIFSKVIGIAVSGWFIWLLSSIKIVKFSNGGCWFSVIFCFAVNIVIYVLYIRKHKADFPVFENKSDFAVHALLIEVIFLALFIIWNYMKSFKPEAYGTTEKMMDYGFMQAMFKSDYMPPEDIWLAGQPINYYYVGQFMATFMTKLAGSTVGYGYNLTMNMLAAFGFVLPFSIVYNLADNFKEKKEKLKDEIFPYFAGVLAGGAVSIAGNMHYTIYKNVIPTIRTLLGLDDMAKDSGYNFSNYWFPNATRYIGHNPETNDKTIHEFPNYSFVLGDLHAHVINIMFVLTVVAILLGFMLLKKKELHNAMTGAFLKNDSMKGIAGFSFKDIFSPCVIAIGFFIGLFHSTNFWDYPIYFVVSGAVILFINCRLYNFSLNTLKLTLFHAVIVIVTAKLIILPFTLNFNQISSEINISANHSPFYQLVILWGLPVVVLLFFLGYLIAEKRGYASVTDRKDDDPGRKNALFRFIGNLRPTDMFVLILGLCALGLVIIPELIYVKDIYSGDYKRANTMFKLAYQAFILFGLFMGYAISKFVFYAKKKGERIFGIIALWLLFTTFGYFSNATKGWFGDYTLENTFENLQPEVDFILNIIYLILGILFFIEAVYLLCAKKKSFRNIVLPSSVCIGVIFIVTILFGEFFVVKDRYKGLDSGLYLMDENYDDFKATNWINENIEGRPVMLEANGSSYTYYERVSTITGLPTILGWRTHEWLWQSASVDSGLPPIISEREDDIETIFTSEDTEEVRELLDKYKVEYIYIGGCEREKFGDVLNLSGLMEQGTVCYPDDFESPDDTYTFILKVGKN